MATSGKGTGVVGYNVQIAVDAEHHLIVAHEVTNIGSDRAQLASMGRKAREATGCEKITVRSEEHTSELQSLMRISYAVFCLKKKTNTNQTTRNELPNKHYTTHSHN